MITAKAVPHVAYSAIIQPISGLRLGYAKRKVWRVSIHVGAKRFLSEVEYSSLAAATRAAKRINAKQEPTP